MQSADPPAARDLRAYAAALISAATRRDVGRAFATAGVAAAGAHSGDLSLAGKDALHRLAVAGAARFHGADTSGDEAWAALPLAGESGPLGVWGSGSPRRRRSARGSGPSSPTWRRSPRAPSSAPPATTRSCHSVRDSLGLGLYIVKQIVAAHGGRIEARSDRETGTTFVVRLPYAVPAAEARDLAG